MDLKNRVAVVTGGASGMGEATAQQLSKQGMHVALLDFNIEKAEQVAGKLKGLAVRCDVSDADSGQKAIEQVVEKYQAIHVLVNCAGIAPAARMLGRDGPMPLDDFNKVIQVNLIGTFNMMRLAAAQMLQQEPLNEDGERGVMINTASVAAYEGQIGQSAYSASKGGIVSLTLPIARELAKFGVRVMTIAPGIIATPMMAGLPEKVQQSLAESIPFPSRLGKPQEYAQLAQHIIENSYLNGSVIRLDAAIRMSAK